MCAIYYHPALSAYLSTESVADVGNHGRENNLSLGSATSVDESLIDVYHWL